MSISPDNYIYLGTFKGIFRAKFSDLISVVEDIENVGNEFLISPIPATDKIFISFSNSELLNLSISIFNSLGIEIKRYDKKELFGHSSITFSTEVLPSGIYYCTINTAKNKKTKSFVVVK